ncbi:hypothetical protein [Deinococcus yunweiensis]|uniref:hypothetical protein n=1 Tax=Deinococcus yunweiensis TaxID=367282 RepID=UPI00398E9720
MTHSTPSTPVIPAQSSTVLSRTWATTTECRPFGEFWGTYHHTVTLTRTPAGITAEVDGQADTLDRAVRILHGATSTTVLSEARATIAA